MEVGIGHALQRLVGAEVRRGEGRLVALFFTNLLLLLAAYYVLKVVREPLILAGGGAISRSYARGLQAALLLALVPAYGLLANRIEPGRLVNGVTAGAVLCLLAFCALGFAGVSLGFVFFVWLGIFSTLAIAQFWSLASDLFSEGEGRRLFPLIATGGTLGGIAGAQLAARGMARLGTYSLMGVAAALLCGCMLLSRAGRRAASIHRHQRPRAAPSARDARSGFAITCSDPYLLLIGAAVLLLNAVSTTGEFILAERVDAHAAVAASLAASAAGVEQARTRFIAAFYGDFQTAITLLSALLQTLLVARLFRVAGVAGSVLLLPLLVVVGYAGAAVLPILSVVALVKIAESGATYSLQNTLQQALFLPTARDTKYKAKAAIDTFLVRAGDLVSAALVFAGASAGLRVRGFALLNVALGVVWLALAARLALRYRRRVLVLARSSAHAPSAPPRVELPAVAPPRARPRRHVEPARGTGTLP